jgi:hypothetical protein
VRNGLVLVGIPLAALCVGVALAAFLTQGLAVERAGVALAVLGILAVGIVIGVIAYRHGRDGTGPVIERIIQKKQEM